MSDFAVYPPFISIMHSNEIILLSRQLAKYNHPWAVSIDASPLVEHLGSCPGVADPHCWVAANPECDQWAV